MIRTIAILGSLVLAITSSSGIAAEAEQEEEGTYPIWLSPHSPVPYLDDVEKAWSRPFLDGVEGRENKYHEWTFTKWEGENEKSAVADNCATIYALEEQGYEAQPSIGRAVYQVQRSDCELLDQLRHVRPAKESFVQDFEFSERSVDILPAFVEIGISCDMKCRYDEANRRGVPISRVWPLHNIESKSEIELRFESGGTKYYIFVMAKGDFDGDGVEDLFVNTGFSYYPNSLSLFTLNQNYVLTRDRPGAVLRVVDPELHLCSARPRPNFTYECQFDQADLEEWLDGRH